jgi:hypothetical protein
MNVSIPWWLALPMASHFAVDSLDLIVRIFGALQ